MENKIVDSFLNYGFNEKADQFALDKHLFDDFTVTAICEEGWIEDGFINFYIYASRFAPFIDTVFSVAPNAKLIQPRKLTKDQLGCLCMASTPIERIRGEWTIWLNGEELQLNNLLLLFSETQSIEEFYDSVYFRNNGYFIWVETIWVYLFLKKCLGMDLPVAIYRDMKQETMSLLVKRWNLKSEPTVESFTRILKGIKEAPEN